MERQTDNPVLDSRNNGSVDSYSAEYKKVLDDAAAALSKESMCIGCVVAPMSAERSSAQVKESSKTNEFNEKGSGADPGSASGSPASNEKTSSNSSQNFAKNIKQDQLPELQLSDLIIKEPENDPSILLDGFAHGMITRPCRAVQQALGMDVEPESLPIGAQGKTHKAGQAIGSLVPFVGLVAITRTASSGFLSDSVPPLARVLGEQAGAGFIMGSLLTPSDLKPGQNLFSARMEQGSQSAATFCTLTGTGASLDQNLPSFGDDKVSILARRVAIGFVTGTVAGFVDPRGITSVGASKEDGLSSVVLFEHRSKDNDASQLNIDWSHHFSKFQQEQFAPPEDPGKKPDKAVQVESTKKQ